MKPLAQVLDSQVPFSITTPDKVESRIGTLEFRDGMPTRDTVDKVYDNLDFTHAIEAFVNAMQGVNMHAVHRGLLDAGVKDNEVIVFSELTDSKSLEAPGIQAELESRPQRSGISEGVLHPCR